MDEGRGIRALEDLAARQWGLFTTAQAGNLGVRGSQCQRLVETGRAERLRRGVYALGGSGLAEHAEVKAAWLTAYPKPTASERLAKRPFDAVVAGRTAAAIRGFGDFYAAPYTIAVRERRQTSQDDLRFPLLPIEDRDVAIVDGLPVASPERIVCDLVRSHEDPDHIGTFMEDAALAGHPFDEDRLSELLAPLAARNGYPKGDGRAFARRLLAEHVEGPLAQRSANAVTGILNAYTDNPAYQRALAELQGASAGAPATANPGKLAPALTVSIPPQLQGTISALRNALAAVEPYLATLSRQLASIIPTPPSSLELPSVPAALPDLPPSAALNLSAAAEAFAHIPPPPAAAAAILENAAPPSPALIDALNHVVLPPPEVLESLNSTIQSLNSLYELKRQARETTDPSDAHLPGADDSTATEPADSGGAFPESGEDHAK